MEIPTHQTGTPTSRLAVSREIEN